MYRPKKKPDLKLVCQNYQMISVHSELLRASSPYFAEKFKNEGAVDCIFLDKYSKEVVQTMVDFLYEPLSVDLHKVDQNLLKQIAENLRIVELKEVLEKISMKKMKDVLMEDVRNEFNKIEIKNSKGSTEKTMPVPDSELKVTNPVRVISKNDLPGMYKNGHQKEPEEEKIVTVPPPIVLRKNKPDAYESLIRFANAVIDDLAYRGIALEDLDAVTLLNMISKNQKYDFEEFNSKDSIVYRCIVVVLDRKFVGLARTKDEAKILATKKTLKEFFHIDFAAIESSNPVYDPEKYLKAQQKLARMINKGLLCEKPPVKLLQDLIPNLKYNTEKHTDTDGFNYFKCTVVSMGKKFVATEKNGQKAKETVSMMALKELFNVDYSSLDQLM